MPYTEYRRYGTLLAAGTVGSETIRISVRKIGTSTFATSADYTPAAADYKVKTDAGTLASITNTPSFDGSDLVLVLTAAELTGKRVRITVANAAIESDDITVWTGAHASAALPYDLWDGTRLGLTALPNAAAGANTGLPVVGTQVPNATAGASGGLHINGSNAGTTTYAALTVTGAFTVTGGMVGNITGNLSGSVGSVTGAVGSVSGITFPSGFSTLTVANIQSGLLTTTHYDTTESNGATTINNIDTNVNAISTKLGTPLYSDLATDLALAGHLAAGLVASTTGATTTLDAGAVNTASYYDNARLVLVAGPGAGQERVITGYATGRIATHAAWMTNPTASTNYEIRAARVVVPAPIAWSSTGNSFSSTDR